MSSDRETRGYIFEYKGNRYGIAIGFTSIHIVYYNDNSTTPEAIFNCGIDKVVNICICDLPPDLVSGIKSYASNEGFAGLSIQEYLKHLELI